MGHDDADLSGGLHEAFKRASGDAPVGGSVLGRIARMHGVGSSILLRDADDDGIPVALQRRLDAATKDDSRYQVLGQIARGGVGVVYRGRDKDLNRDVALKVLRKEFAQREDVLQRFLEEAQVGGQLQHPGIVPVYGIGMQDDHRPSFAMKLIKGATLAELLDSNPRGVDLIVVFEQVVQTMAYAHSRGVIHRDLKPSNVMIGAFGEVHVVDWGFAKVLAQAEVERAPDSTVIATVRSGPVGSQSVVGSAMGTPAYMPPEQAMGAVDDMDERCDVFSLGAILCELLTGRPPYTGEPRDQLISAHQCRLGPAHERLDRCDAADELKQLVRDCLEPLTADRPRSAGVVAERLAAHLAEVQERARRSELDAVAAQAAAARERHARKRTLGLAAAALAIVVAAGGGYGVWKVERDARIASAESKIASALREATGHEGRADWAAAVAAAQRAVDAAESHGVDAAEARGVFERCESERVRAAEAARVEAEDAAFLAELDAIREGAVHTGFRAKGPGDAPQRAVAVDAAFAAAFDRRFGSLEASVARLAGSRHAAEFAAVLGYWCKVRREHLESQDWAPIDRCARRVDPDHAHVRDALVGGDAAALRRVADEEGDELQVELVVLVGEALLDEGGQPEAAVAFLRRQALRAPGDVQIHHVLSHAARALRDHELALRHMTAAVAAAPESYVAHSCRGEVLSNHFGRHEDAVRESLRCLELEPDDAAATQNLGAWSQRAGDLEGALAAARRAVALDVDREAARGALEHVLLRMGDLDGALSAAQEWVELDPDSIEAVIGLATVRKQRGQREAALVLLSKALEMEPDMSQVLRISMGLWELGDRAAAMATVRRLLEREPENIEVLHWLGHYSGLGGEFAEGEGFLRRALELDPTQAPVMAALGELLCQSGRLDEGVRTLRRALELDPWNADANQLLVVTLSRMGRLDEALVAAREASEAHPRHADYQSLLGSSLLAVGDLESAGECFRAAVRLQPGDPRHHFNLGFFCESSGNLSGAIESYRHSAELAPTNIQPITSLGGALSNFGRYEEAVDVLRRALELDPRDPTATRFLAITLLSWGHSDAVEPLRELARLQSQNADVQHFLGLLLRRRGDRNGAIASFERAVECDPSRFGSWRQLGLLRSREGDVAGAAAAWRRALALESGVPAEAWVRHELEKLSYQPRLSAVLAGDDEPADVHETLVFASLAHGIGQNPPAALRLYRRAFELDPATILSSRVQAAQAASLAGDRSHAQALEWLRAELAHHAPLVEADPRSVAAGMLALQSDEDFAPIRDAADLPEEFVQFWADVEALRKRAVGDTR